MQSNMRGDKMFLIGIWVEAVFYGLNCALFVASLYALACKSSRRERSWFLIAVSSILFSLSTAYVSMSLQQLLEVFIYTPPGTDSPSFDRMRPLSQSKLILYPLNVATQNLVLIWRLWAVWGCKWFIIIIPIVLQIVQTTSAYVALYASLGRSNADHILLVYNLSLINWVIDLAINIGATGLIAYRLWNMGRSVRVIGSSEKEYYSVMRMVIESGALCSAATLIEVCIFISDPTATITAIDSLAQISTISPLLIIVRVGLGLAGHQSIHSDQTSGSNDTKIEFSRPHPREAHVSMGEASDSCADHQVASYPYREPPRINKHSSHSSTRCPV